MKLRLRSNSIRLRLTRSEVARLAEAGVIEERTQFGPGRELVYQLEQGEHLGAMFDGMSILVTVPQTEAMLWAKSEKVGMEGVQEGDPPLSILIEKDFQCVHGEKDLDAYEGEVPL